jgi:hypothetical protein
MIWPHEDTPALNTFYGDPRGTNGQASAAWQAENLVQWVTPYPMFYSDGKHTPMEHLHVHKKCLSTFHDAFTDVLQTMGIDKIRQLRLDVTGGTFCFRPERGGSRLSVHSLGCAIDMDPGHNPFPHVWEPGRGMIDPQFASILQKHGFCWRGAHNDVDSMHFSWPTTSIH